LSKQVYIFSIPLLFCACKKTDPALFQLLPPNRTGIDFANNLAEGDSLNILNYVYYYNGGGVGIGDFNNDGLEDIFFSGNEVSSRLYLNKGNLKFEDITQAAGLETTAWCTGVAVADVNADGWLDIYVCTAGHPQPERRRNLLFINNGTSQSPITNHQSPVTFTEQAAEYGLADTSYSTQAAFFDYDLDGDLDLYLLNHANERATLNTPLPKKTNGEGSSTDRLYRNNGNGTFTDVSREAGILTEGYGLGIAISDVNGDGWPDIYVANDFIYNDLLWVNEGGKRFTNQSADYFAHQTYNSMGCDFADFNNDAQPDLITVDMLPETDSQQKMMAGVMTWDKWQLIERAGYEPQYMRNSLQLAATRPTANSQQPTAFFSEIGQLAGVQATDWSWAPLFADFDNDGRKDLFISNGYLRDITDKDFIDYTNSLSMFKSQGQADRDLLPKIRQLKGKMLPNRIFRNNGNLTFEPKFEAWGLTQSSFSNGAAYADLDNDGDLDLVTNNLNEPAFIYENRADKSNYLNIRLEGLPENSQGIGAKVTIAAGGQKQYLEQYLSRGFMSSTTGVLHVGLGDKTTCDSLTIQWPNGKRQVLTEIPANQTLTLHQTDAQVFIEAKSPTPNGFLVEKTNENGLAFQQEEQPFNDFRFQPLLPHGFSQNGPSIAIGDLNGDGLDDAYVGGAAGQPGVVFTQKSNGQFQQADLPESADFEDVDAVFFDADMDGDLDLLAVSGSNERGAESDFYQSRLYRNDGQGRFSWDKNALPAMREPASCAAVADFDGDGDMDIFIGGSAVPGSYPLASRSYLLRNEKGVFTDLTSLVPELEKPGIVTAAAWSDLDKNGSPDLVLAGEWMPVTVFKNNKGKLVNATAELGLEKTSGWWNALAISDLNGDGFPDLVVGNRGLNSKFKASDQAPLRVYAADFDQNGSIESIICRQAEGKEKPIHQRDELMAQVNALERRFPKYALYATASVQQVFEEKSLAQATQKDCRVLASTVFLNKGGKGFSAKPLPLLAQVSSLRAIACEDVNHDGKMDLVLGGNDYSQAISIGQADASHGLVLLGDGVGEFSPMPAERSGFFIQGMVNDLAVLNRKNRKKLLLAGVNGGALRVFEFRENEPGTSLGDAVTKIGF
jgi:hypothetical protein